MSWRWWRRLRRTFGPATNAEIDDELRFHVDLLAAEYMRAGLAPAAAAAAAERRFGNRLATRDRARDLTTIRWMEETVDDLRLALRLIRRHAGFSLTIAATLALGIGLTTSIFAIVDAVLLRPLPYAAPDQLVAIWHAPSADPGAKLTVPYAEFRRWRANARTFSTLAAASWFRRETVLTGAGSPRALLDVAASAELFSMLGARTASGRTFDDRDSLSGCVTVLSHHFWQSLAGGDDVVGRSLRLDDRDCRVVGVMPASFVFFPEPTDLWTLITPDSELSRDPEAHVAVFGRLAPGIPLATAASELRALSAASVFERAPGTPAMLPVLNGLQEEFTWLAGRNLRITLVVLFCAVGSLLMIACMNVSALLLGRSMVRTRELAIRGALGSTRLRLLRQLSAESLLLGCGGTLAGTLFTAVVLRVIRATMPVPLPPGTALVVNLPVLLFAAAIGTAAAVAIGLVPAWRISRVNFNELVAAGGRGVALPSRQVVTRCLIAAQAALSVLLLTGAGLLVQSVDRFSSTRLAFDPRGVYSYGVTPPAAPYTQREARAALYGRIVEAFDTASAAGELALSSVLPPRGGPVAALEQEGAPAADARWAATDTQQQSISGGYFDVMRMRLLRGRSFGPRDAPAATAVCIVNDALVRKHFGLKDPIGQRIRLAIAPPGNDWLTIVGVVSDEDRVDVRQELGWVRVAIVYLPITQRPVPAVQLIVRPRHSLEDTVVHRLLQGAEPGLVVGTPRPLEGVVDDYFRYPLFRAVLLSGFAALALLLAGVGLYAVLAQTVARRTREIGIRMALGEGRERVILDIVRQGLGLTAAGIGVGLALTVPLRWLLTGLLYGIAPNDAATLISVCALLLLAGCCASYLPARRASRIDPLLTLHAE